MPATSAKPTYHADDRILVSGTRDDDSLFSEEAHTVIVNAHGALILLAERVKPGQVLTVRHLKAGKDRDCTVIEAGEKHQARREISIEPLDPSPGFWHVAFPPEDWSPRSPEAKRIGTVRSVLSKPDLSDKAADRPFSSPNCTVSVLTFAALTCLRTHPKTRLFGMLPQASTL